VGSWGVKARQSDYGLDMLALIETNYLKPIDFKCFDVKGIMDFCKQHIIKGIRREEEPYLSEDDDIQEYIDANLPYRYDTVIRLVAECVAEYLQNRVFIIKEYNTNKKMRISEFIFADGVLGELLEALKKMLDPNHDTYKSWIGDETLAEWKTHMQMLCDTISQAMSKGGDDNA